MTAPSDSATKRRAERRWRKDTTIMEEYDICRATVWNWEKRGIFEKQKFGGAPRFRERESADNQP